jgi:hypothetical protein
MLAEICQYLGQNFLGRNRSPLPERLTRYDSLDMPSIAVIEQGYPIRSVRKDPPHDLGRFGRP